nr:MAG: thymidylate synthase, flavin-dependent [Candidatus Nanosalinarum sp. J07AB56]
MKVELLDYTDKPEKTVAMAARNDYSDDWVADVGYEAAMEPIDFDQGDYEWVEDNLAEPSWDDARTELEAKKKSLLEQLLDREHYGVFEHPSASFAINDVSRSLMAQLTRHRHMSFDVQSQRYVDFEDKDIVVPETLRDSDEHLSRDAGLVDLDEDVRQEYRQRYDELMDDLTEFYGDAVEDGVPKEDARFALPIGSPVNIVASGNLRSLMHVMNIRGKANAQWEVRELADEMNDELHEVAPITANYFEENAPFKLGL